MSVLSTTTTDLDPMILTENQQGNVILEKLRIQAENEMYCDVAIYVENTKFNLHRNVLASFSPYFERIFQSAIVVNEKFNVISHSAEIFKHFVNYMYSGMIVLHKNNVAELLKLAHHLEVEKLKIHCAEYLERHLDTSNCLKVRSAADNFAVEHLSKRSKEFIKVNINDIISQNLYLDIDVYELDSLLAEADLGLPEGEILRIILEWIRFDIPNRERDLSMLVKHIKCTHLDPQYLSNVIETNQLFVNSEISLFITLRHLNLCGLTFERYLGLLDELSRRYTDLSMEIKKPEREEGFTKIGPLMERKNKKRLLRGNPIARLVTLRSALLLRRKLNKKRRKAFKQQSKINQKMPDDEDDCGPLKCHLCAHFSSDTTALEHHLSSVHSRDVTYKCGVCGYVCQWNNLYLEHIKGHFPGPPYKCDSCEYTCNKLNSVLTHRSVHADEKAVKCALCSFRCRTQNNLFSHMKGHSVPEKHGERPYICDVCGFNTKFLSHLVAHKRLHSSDLYRCSYPHCKFTTGKKAQLGSHAKSHQGVRPHNCQICGRGFLEKSHLVRHERIHLEEKPFKCHECDYASSRRDKLKEHQARHHGDHASAKVPYKARPTKKASQLYPESYSPGENSGRGPTGSHSSSSDMPDVLNQHHNLTLASSNAYPIFTPAETHHNTPASAFHQQQLLNGSVRGKDHRSVHQTTAAAVTAAMILDPRFHHGGSGASPYVAPVAVPPTSQPGSQVTDYPAALMSLF